MSGWRSELAVKHIRNIPKWEKLKPELELQGGPSTEDGKLVPDLLIYTLGT